MFLGIVRDWEFAGVLGYLCHSFVMRKSGALEYWVWTYCQLFSEIFAF
jgi:hypothetical protein